MLQKIQYNPHLEIRIKFDASIAILEAAMEHRSTIGWHTVAFISRFL